MTSADQTELSHNTLNGWEVFGQAIAAIAPSATVAGLPAIIAVNAGEASWVSILIAMLVTMLIAKCLVVFAKHMSSSGSLYTYVAKSLGASPAFATGLCLAAGYIAIAIASLFGLDAYLDAFMADVGIDTSGLLSHVITAVIAALVCATLAFRGMRLATRVAIVLELLSVIGIAVLMTIVLCQKGLHIDTAQFDVGTFSWNGIFLGVVLGFTSFVGFESAASLGAEARDPGRMIPRSVYVSVIVSGIAYLIAVYTLVLGFGGAKDLGSSNVPLEDLAVRAGVGWLKYYIDLGVCFSYFAGLLACLNAASRQLYTFGKERVVTRWLAEVSVIHGTPAKAIFFITPLVVVFPVIMLGVGVKPLDGNGYAGTTGAYFFLLAYALMAAGAPIFAKRRGLSAPGLPVVAAISVLVILYVFYNSIVPVPAYPFNILPYIFAAVVVASFAWYALLVKTDATLKDRIGSFEDELDGPAPLLPLDGGLAKPV